MMQRKKNKQEKWHCCRKAVCFGMVAMITGCGPHQSSASKENKAPEPAVELHGAAEQTLSRVADTQSPVIAPLPEGDTAVAPTAVPSKDEKTPDALIKQARGFAKKGQWGDAVSILEKARKEFPENTTVLGELGWAAFNNDRRSLSREASTRAVALEQNPKVKAAFLYNLGRVEEESYRNPLDAIAAYRQSLKLRPNDTVEKRLAELESKLQPTGDGEWATYDDSAKRFSYQGNIISPECVSTLTGLSVPNDHVALSDCQGLVKNVKFEKGEYILLRKEDYAPDAYDRYEVLAYNGDQFLIHSGQDGGGTHTFEDLFIASLKDNKLNWVLRINGGDGCYHGAMTVEPSPKENTVEYTYSVCAKDILDFDSIGKTLPVEDCEDVNCSALCCIGDARMSYDFNTHATTFLGVELDGETLAVLDDDKGTRRYQPCFNALLREVTDAAGGHEILTPQKLSDFVGKFSKRCLK